MRGVLFLTFLFISSLARSQYNDYFLQTADNELSVEVSRGTKGVKISLLFTNASQFEYVMIEKSAAVKDGFTQCKYISFSKSVNDSIVVVQHDIYPLPGVNDAFYRIKTITKDGILRIYPSIRLPGLHPKKYNVTG